MKPDSLPPHSIESEQGVLGCALLAGADVWPQLAEAQITEAHFYDARHATIFRHGLRLFTANTPVDFITLQAAMQSAGVLEQVGGLPYLSQLQDTVPSAANLSAYLDVVKEKHVRRVLVKTCAEITSKVFANEGTLEAMLDGIDRELTAVATAHTPANAIRAGEIIANEVVPELEEHYTRGRTNLPPGNISTSFDYFDKVSGGIATQDYVVLAGRPGAGKTALAMNIAVHHALAGLPVAIFSLEMTRKALMRRVLFCLARVSMGKFRQGFATKRDFEALTAAAARLSKIPLYIDDSPSQTIGMIESKARALARQQGIKLFVLDYLQLVLPNERRGGRIDRVQELADISARFVAMKKRGTPWLLLAQMNRNIEQTESQRVPVLSDLKDSGSIEQDADQVWFLYFPAVGKTRTDKEGNVHRDKRALEEEWLDDKFAVDEEGKAMEHTERPARVNLYQAKHREGATGPVEFLFRKNMSWFQDWRQFATAEGFAEYGKGEREKQNPYSREIDPEDVPR